MVHSVLVYRDLPSTRQPARATIIPIHGNQGTLDDLVPLAQSLGSDLRIAAPEAARGVHDVKHFVIGHSWYANVRPDKPEPASFGDSLAQVEQFIADVHERTEPDESSLPWLLGYREGAVMSLAAAGVLPDLVAGVMAICGAIPEVRDWAALSGTAEGLPILLISDPKDPVIQSLTVRQNFQDLQTWGASVTHLEIAGARDLGGNLSDTLREWLGERTITRQGIPVVTP